MAASHPAVTGRFFTDVGVISEVADEKKVEEMRAVIMHAMWRRQAPRRMKYQPAE